MSGDITFATAGENFGSESEPKIVAERCEEKTYGGYWFCIAHGPLRHNMEAAGHTAPACRVAWYCFGHDVLEVP